MIFEPEELKTKEVYKLMIGSIVPRPIALVSSVSAEGRQNVAPFSFFTGVASNPPTIAISTARKGRSGDKKDTRRNIEDTGEFVINIVTEDIAEAMHQSSSEYPPEVSEFEAVGLTPIPSQKVRAPRVNESPVQFECRLHQIVEIGEGGAGSASLIIAEIVLFHFEDTLVDQFRVDLGKLKPVGRLAGNDYTTLGKIFSLLRKPI